MTRNGRPTVLAVDDDPAILHLLSLVLDSHFDVRTAASGAGALALLREHPANVVLLDLLMPGIDGLEALQRIKILHPRIEVVVVTAVRNPHLVIAALQQGAFTYLTKPFDQEELRATVSNAVARQERRAGGGAVEQAGPVVLAGEQPGMLIALESLLARSFIVRTAVTAAGAVRILRSCTPALVVLHHSLPAAGRRAVMQALRARAPRCRVVESADAADDAEQGHGGGGAARPAWLPWALHQITAVLHPTQLPAGFPPRMSSHVLEAIDYIGRHHGQPLSLRGAASRLGISPGYLASLFRREVGIGFRQYVTRIRVAVARALLAEDDTPLEHLAEAVGFSDASHLSRAFVEQVGERPGRYRRHRIPGPL